MRSREKLVDGARIDLLNATKMNRMSLMIPGCLLWGIVVFLEVVSSPTATSLLVAFFSAFLFYFLFQGFRLAGILWAIASVLIAIYFSKTALELATYTKNHIAISIFGITSLAFLLNSFFIGKNLKLLASRSNGSQGTQSST